ncbi:putative NBD/HSP70 family sugar kinase [Labedella gwakjiensis]|uniref:Putative NBD/HSP70 family sugar kinase n=1 Tax=Labedella gwakjiensis TaxID=390269 RepID=A0A2P8GTX9_9MICO|nr:ROK family transcriptional regulator [Labedella gwakjiensis]PSL37428.1 putative NBD/HSP70 family sugar kinase [Labedella gwakjiensis]RUQ84743.1 ROK family transcriptional regulator [Labedella gwakjiensis]
MNEGAPTDGSSGVHRWPELHPTTQAAFNQVLWRRGLPRTEIARRLGVSRTRLTAITRDLEEAGLIVEGKREQRSSTGRPAEMLHAVTTAYQFLGLHLHGMEVIAALVDLDGRVVWEDSATLSTETPDELVDVASRFLRSATESFRVAGVAVCGPLARVGLDSAAARIRAVDDALLDRFEAEWGIPLWVDDDVVALTAFEQWPQLGEGQDSLVLISIGEEIGFGVVTHLQILRGARRAAGRFDHVPVLDDGPECPLGHRGCLWSVTSTRAIQQAVPEASSLAEIAALAAEGDPLATAVLERAATGLGTAAGHVANLLDPHKLVLTGESHTVLGGRIEAFTTALRRVHLSDEEVEVAMPDYDFVEWARAAAALALYRVLSSEFF